MTDFEFQDLIKLQKIFKKSNIILPNKGEREKFDLISKSTNDKFYLDINRRGRIELSKCTLQTRWGFNNIPLVRIDIDSPNHMNPDGVMKSRNHIHIYKGSINATGNLPWAYDLEEFGIRYSNFMQVFYDFCAYCNIETNKVQGVI